jgi:hypothetical protein
MDPGSKLNATSAGPIISLPPFVAGFAISDASQSPVALGIVAVVTAVISFLAYKAYRPPVHPLSPAFTKDTLPILGSFGFVARQW